MNTAKAKNVIEELLSLADIKINGQNPWDVQVYNEGFFSQALLGGSLGGKPMLISGGIVPISTNFITGFSACLFKINIFLSSGKSLKYISFISLRTEDLKNQFRSNLSDTDYANSK
jgi:hypothetical protein